MPEGCYVTRWSEFHLLPGVAEAIGRLNRAGLRVVVVSNQRGVSLGLYTTADVRAIHTSCRTFWRVTARMWTDSIFAPTAKGNASAASHCRGCLNRQGRSSRRSRLKPAHDRGLSLGYRVWTAAGDADGVYRGRSGAAKGRERRGGGAGRSAVWLAARCGGWIADSGLATFADRDIWGACSPTLATTTKTSQGWDTADSRSKCNICRTQKKQEYRNGCGGKDGKQRTFPTFPPHGYGYLFI